MYRYISLLCISLILLAGGCGKKKNVFAFQSSNNTPPQNPLTLSTVKKLELTKLPIGNHLSWSSIQHKNVIGYNIYKFSKNAFIPKHPINRSPINNPSFLDKDKKTIYTKICYLVKGIFSINNKTIEGPASKIIYTTNI